MERDMYATESNLFMRTFSIFLLYLFQPSTGNICSAPEYVEFTENNSEGDIVTVVTVQNGVTLMLNSTPDNPFRLQGNNLTAAKVFDYETKRDYEAVITCTDKAPSVYKLDITIIVLVTNVNDNPPVFDQNTYHVNVSEMSPVGTSVGHFAATDQDKPHQLFYKLTPDSKLFKLRSPTIPDVLTDSTLNYDRVQNVRFVLYAQDTPLTTSENSTSFTASTTIMVTITDDDNRPPWFQPCTKHINGEAVICYTAGYTGSVFLNETQTGILPLKPGPLYAIDGDSGINEEITYTFLSGNDVFEINANTGNISMLKPANKLENIHLTVLASQKKNRNQFATTTVTVSVVMKSLYPPQFQKSHYKGLITKAGSMAMDNDEPLFILATDKDYNEGINPFVIYSVNGSTDFTIINGYFFMTKDLPETTLSLHVVATDKSNNESDTAEVLMEVKSGLTSTIVPMSTTPIMTTTPIGEFTSSSKTTENIQMSTTNHKTSTTINDKTSIPSTSEGIISTTKSSIATTTASVSTYPSLTSEGSNSSDSTDHPPPVILPSGNYGLQDMAALGVTLGILLFACLVVIGVLVHHLRKEKADWRKVYEVNVFRNSLGQNSGGFKEGFQYTNEAFQNTDEEGISSSPLEVGGEISGRKAVNGTPLKKVDMAWLPDDTSQMESNKADNEKEVKPILTKERRMEEGYKAVWFKEDIDPNAKQEMVIIDDRRVDESEEEEEEEEEVEEVEDKSSIMNLEVDTHDTDLDSGLGLKMGDPPEVSHDDDDETLTSDL